MKKNALVLIIMILVVIGNGFAGGYFVKGPPASCSTNYPGSFVTVGSLSYSPSGQITLGLVESSITFVYNFSPTSTTDIQLANTMMALLLTAKSTGVQIMVYLPNQTGCPTTPTNPAVFSTVQFGP